MRKMFVIYAEYHDYDDSDHKCLMVTNTEEEAKRWVVKAKRIYAATLLAAAKRRHKLLVEKKKTKSTFIWWYKRNIWKLGLNVGRGNAWEFNYKQVIHRNW